ncbi:hypothetical protein X975_03484, partial [Stegodyphus mimosarum]
MHTSSSPFGFDNSAHSLQDSPKADKCTTNISPSTTQGSESSSHLLPT